MENFLGGSRGYADLAFDDYELLYTGAIEQVTVSEEQLSLSITDKRSTLKKKVQYSCTEKNALEAIREILLDKYLLPYTSVFYDTTAWAAAEAVAPDITIDISGDDTEEVIKIIENICTSIFGFFNTTADGKYTFRFVDTSATSETTILHTLNRHEVKYDPSEVVSSVKIAYGETASGYSYFTDTTRETDVFTQYRVYNEREFKTYLPDATAASVLSTSILDYTEDVHGAMEVDTAIRYYDLEVGDTVDIVVNRSVNEMLGTKKAEVVKVAYDLAVPKMKIGVRFV